MANSSYLRVGDSVPGRHHTLIPWLSLLLMTVSALCIAAAASTLRILNGEAVEKWIYNPAFILAIISSVFNVCLSSLVSLGIATLWWRVASHGTTLKELHQIWDRRMGLTFLSSITGGSHARHAALAAAIIAVARFSNGPLLQQSPGNRWITKVHDTPMKIVLNRIVPEGYLNTRLESPTNVSITGRGAEVFRLFLTNYEGALLNAPGNLTTWLQHCPQQLDTCGGFACPNNSTCIARVPFLMTRSNCSIFIEQFNFTDPRNFDRTIFSIDSHLRGSPEDPFLRLETKYNNFTDADCVGRMVNETCDIRLGIFEQRVALRWSNFTLQPPPWTNATSVEDYVYSGDTPGPMNAHDYRQLPEGDYPAGVLLSLQSLVINYYSGDAILTSNSSVTSAIITKLFWNTVAKKPDCSNVYQRPATTILNSMNFLLFIASHWSATGNSTTTTKFQDITAEEYRPTLQYYIDATFVGTALGVMLAGLISVASLFWGIWELDRIVTLSPLETAKAFNAPLLDPVDRAIEAEDIITSRGQTKVQYDGRSFRATDADELQELEELRAVIVQD